NPVISERFEEGLDNTDYIMVVSDAFTDLLTPFTAVFPFDIVLVADTTIVYHEVIKRDQILHHQVTMKKEKINEALRTKLIDWKNSFADADSYSDLSVLELVGNPVAVDPDQDLRNIALERDWEIIEVKDD